MGRKSKLGKGRQDKYYYLAKEQGYRSRAAFKLVQLNKKYNFLSGARVLVDLCAAPGGWLQVAAKYMPVSSIIIGVDLVPIKPIKNCITITDDITTDSCRSKLKKEMKTWLADVFIHDGAPNVGKAWIQDAYSQSELTLHSLRLATEFLTAGGTFVTKVFRSAEYTSLLYVFNQLFRRVEATKPSASRSTSAEIYVVCRGYLAPKKIDPRLLDPRFAFQEIEEHISSATALFKKRKKPNRSGYREGPIYKQITLAGFVNGDSPVMALADNFVIVHDDEESRRYAEQKEFGVELENLCQDLHVLSRHDFQKLLRFRDTMRKRFPTEADLQAEKEKAEEEAKNAPKPLTAEEEEEALDQKLQESVKSKAKMERRERRKKNRARTRTHNRLTLEMHHQVAVGDLKLNDDTGLFDLLGVTDGDTLQTMTENVPANFDPDMYLSDEDGRDDESSSESEESDPEESSREKYTRLLEQEMDLQYRDYCRRRGKSMPAAAAPAGMKRKERKPKDVDMWDAVQDSLTNENAHQLSEMADVNSKNPLIVKDQALAPEDTDATLKGWFGQDLFHDLLNPSSEPLNLNSSTTATTSRRRQQPKLDFPQRRQVDEEMRKRVIKQLEEDSDSSSGDERQKARALRKKRIERQLAKDTFTVVPVDHDDDDEEEDADDSENEERQAERMAAVVAGPQALSKKRHTRGRHPSLENSDDDEDGEDSDYDRRNDDDDDDDLPDDEGPRADSESDGEEYEYEVEAAQYVLAYAKNLIRQIGKIDPSHIVDDSYNRWALPDNESRPSWFAIDTSGHEKPQLPVTHQDMEEMKARAKAVDARPIKKIAEAQGRKRRRLQQKMAKLKEKAKQIASQGDLTDRDKLKAVERLVARQLKTKKTEKFYVVRTKNHVGRKLPKAPGGSRLHLVDRRMKKDKAALAKLTKQKAKRPRKH